MSEKWEIRANKIDKMAKKINKNVLFKLRLLFEDLINTGAAIGWPNYGKLKNKKGSLKMHCHLQKGKPTYVCCWEITDKKRKIIEVYYVGTHEKAPY